jgi:hypothetical protein
MTTTAHDYSAYQEQPTEDMFRVLHDLVERQVNAEAAVLTCEEELKRAKEVLRQIAEVQLPAHLDQMKLQEFTLQNGLKVEVGENIRASIPKDKKAEAIKWLIDNGHGGLVKTSVAVGFGAGEVDKAMELQTELLKLGFVPESDTGVHASTLGAFVRGALEEGQDIPLDLLGVYRQRVTTVALPKAKRTKTKF